MRTLARVLAIAVVALALLYGLASLDWCPVPQRPPSPRPNHVHTAEGELMAGAAGETMQPPFPIVVAGYPLPHGEANGSTLPLKARAIALQVAATRVVLLSLDLLAVSEKLTEEIRREVSDLGLSQLWVLPTHTHSSFGGYDSRPLAEAIGTGVFRKDARETIVQSSRSVIRRAVANLAKTRAEYGERRAELLVAARSEGPAPDGHLGILRFEAGGRPIAEMLFFGAHPTLVPRQTDSLDPDYPGFFSTAQEKADAGVAMVVQTGLGNSTPASDPETPDRAAAYARALESAVRGVELQPIASSHLGLSRATISLPHADASRIVPKSWARIANNLLCYSAPREAELSALKIGDLLLLFVPGEPTAGAAQELLRASHATQVVALANGYVGYIESEELVQHRQGESIRQYFAPALLGQMIEGAQAVTQPLLPPITLGK